MKLPPVVDRETWLRERAELLVREKAHTREGDAIAAARRRLPMTEVANVQLEGPDGPVSFLDLFEGRDQLVVYRHMWHLGQPIEGQCQGCTISIWDVNDAVYLREQGVSFAITTMAPYPDIEAYRDFMGSVHPWYSTLGIEDPAIVGDGGGEIACFIRQEDRVFLTYETTGRGVEAIMSTLKLLDLTVYGRQEEWEDSPEGWPQRPAYAFWSRDGRPTAQWTRPGATPASPHDLHHH